MGKQKDTTVKLALAIVSLLVALYLAELVVFLLDTRFTHTRENMARRIGILFDTRTVLEVIEDLQMNGVEACPMVPASLVVGFNGIGNGTHKLFTLGGVSRKATVYCNESGDYTIYESDEHGFNNPAGIWRQKPKVVLIGDSFTQGACVGPGEDVAGQLRKMGINALNLGMGGCGPLIELAMMKEYVELLKPEFVLWMYFEGNDLREIMREKTSFFARYYFDDGFSQNLIYRQAEIDQALLEFIQQYKQMESAREQEEKRRQQRKWRGVLRLKAIRTRLLRVIAQSSLPEHAAPPDPMFEAILAKALQKTSSWAGKLVFVYMPEYYRYFRRADHENFRQRREVLSIIKKLSIPLIDVHEVFASRQNPLLFFPFKFYGHYTADGYRVVAEAIASSLHREFIQGKK
ncbi:MAG: hypothetical protein ACREOO_05440 [bacterium]